MMIFAFMFTFTQTSEFNSSVCKTTHVEIFQYRFTPGLTQRKMLFLCNMRRVVISAHRASAELSPWCIYTLFILLTVPFEC